MANNEIQQSLSAALAGRHLLEHPFYLRWEAGELGRDELGRYAEQYRHIEAALPLALAGIAAALPEGDARRLVEANLSDELTQPVAHTELFEVFAAAVDASNDVAPLPATAGVVERYLTDAEVTARLSTLAAYEIQAAEIAKSKADGLCRHYGLDAEGTAFWDLHGRLEADHARWSTEALAAAGADPEVVFAAARASADAWWSFLDEREAAACA